MSPISAPALLENSAVSPIYNASVGAAMDSAVNRVWNAVAGQGPDMDPRTGLLVAEYWGASNPRGTRSHGDLVLGCGRTAGVTTGSSRDV
jgi:hypothetical protein